MRTKYVVQWRSKKIWDRLWLFSSSWSTNIPTILFIGLSRWGCLRLCSIDSQVPMSTRSYRPFLWDPTVKHIDTILRTPLPPLFFYHFVQWRLTKLIVRVNRSKCEGFISSFLSVLLHLHVQICLFPSFALTLLPKYINRFFYLSLNDVLTNKRVKKNDGKCMMSYLTQSQLTSFSSISISCPEDTMGVSWCDGIHHCRRYGHCHF